MKVVFETDSYSRMFNLGIELWFPNRRRSWKRLQVKCLFGPYVLEVTFGSRQQYDEQTALLSNYYGDRK